jgi:uncharacterized damage-inducible protein DinB
VNKKLYLFPLAACMLGALTTSPGIAEPVSGVGMASTAQQAPAQVYTKLFADQAQEVISAAEAMPADKYGFKPSHGTFEGVRTFGEQVAHIAASQYYFFGNFGVKSSANSEAIQKLTGKDDIVKALKDSYAFAAEAIATMTPANAFAVVGAHQSTRAGLAASGLAHSNDHYGQMVVYLRMNGVVPPASRKP